MDRKLDNSFTTYPWCWRDKYVGRWTIEVPLKPEEYGVFGHGCLLDLVEEALNATEDIFFPTQVECGERHTLFEQPLPLPADAIREALDRRWSIMAADEDYEPACDIHGVTYMYVRHATGVTRSLVPHAMSLRLESDPGKKPVARLSIYTKCDAWLERTLEGEDNASIGTLNGPMLADKLIGLETRLGGTIADARSDYDTVYVDRYGLKNK
ncbi:MAG: hypothetical protein A4E28_01597 [Methanocella sp. PtaU1.Bin125]|nr:MAG: hypothetical protein A4E28_01597 [Methanocella sp. PtaU1.Bin125]